VNSILWWRCIHDQGHIPMKLLGFDEGVNVSIGLPIIRTSVDHGTAFDIAGKGWPVRTAFWQRSGWPARWRRPRKPACEMATSLTPEREVLLPYGEQELVFRLPGQNLLAVLSRSLLRPSLTRSRNRRAMAQPTGMPRLAEAAKNARKVVIIADDLTRQTPLKLIIPELLTN